MAAANYPVMLAIQTTHITTHIAHSNHYRSIRLSDDDDLYINLVFDAACDSIRNTPEKTEQAVGELDLHKRMLDAAIDVSIESTALGMFRNHVYKVAESIRTAVIPSVVLSDNTFVSLISYNPGVATVVVDYDTIKWS